MARSTRGSHARTTWAVAQATLPRPRVVRLGRAANDNFRRPSLQVRLLVVTLATMLVMMALYDWRLL